MHSYTAKKGSEDEYVADERARLEQLHALRMKTWGRTQLEVWLQESKSVSVSSLLKER